MSDKAKSGYTTDPRPNSTGSPALAPVSGSAATVRIQKASGWETSIQYEDVEVRVMAIAEGYAMVRRKGCAPFVIEANRLMPQNDQDHGRAKRKP